MKKLLLPILLLVSINLQAQDWLLNFALEKEEMEFENVFHPEDTTNMKARAINQLRSITGVTRIEEDNTGVTAEINGMRIDYKKYGCPKSIVPLAMHGSMTGRLNVQFKEGKYRLVIQNMYFTSDIEMSLYGVSSNGGAIAMEEIFTRKKRTEIKRGKDHQRVLGSMNLYFTDMLTLKKEASASEDW